MTPNLAPLRLLKHQLAFALDDHEFVALVGGLGCGKSFAIGAKLFMLAYQNQGYPGMLITRSGNQMHNLMVEVEKVFQLCGLEYLPTDQFRRSERPMTYSLFDGKIYLIRWTGSTVSEIFCETSENRAYTRWAGGNRAFAVIDEIDTMPSAEEVWRFAGDRVRIGPVNQLACASTPEGYGFLWEFFEDKPSRDPENYGHDRQIIRGCSFDNPHVNRSWLKRQIQTRDPLTLRAYIYGEFVNMEGALVYHRFNPDHNVTKLTLADFDKDYIAHVGVDWNKNINAASICFIKDRSIYAVDECFGATDAAELISQLTKKLHGRPIRIYPDASGYEAIRQFERAFGAHNVIYDPANPDVAIRVATVNERMATPSGVPTTFINRERCEHLFNGLMRQVKNKKGEPDKTKGWDHACFVGSTPVHTTNGIVPIERLVGTSGDLVSINGKIEPFMNVRCTRIGAKVVTLFFSDGTRVTCTPDHKFLTPDGWVQAIDLIGRVVINSSNNVEELLWTQSSSHQLVKSSMENASTSQETTSIPFGQVENEGCTESCGNITMDQSRKSTTFITSMVTPPTTLHQIFNVFHRPFTFETMWLEWLNSRAITSNQKFARKHSSELQNGTAAQKDENGIKKMAMPTSTRNEAHSRVNSVVMHSSPSELAQGFAGNPVENGLKTVCLDLQIEEEVADVYCLEVPTTHAFAVGTGGLIAHNCDGFGYFVHQTMPLEEAQGTITTRR